jgi:erythritol/L-threitol dehydrogenase
MSDMMQAVVNHGPGDYRLETVPRPQAGPEEVVLRIDAAGMCGSAGKCFAGGEMFWSGDDPWVKAPVIPGHEFFGTVVQLGPGAADKHGVEIGDRAIAEQIYPCDRCLYCVRGEYWMCEVHDIYGFQRDVADGAWADEMRLGARSRIHKMPGDISLEAGVLVEPLACAIHAVERATIRLGETVVIAGAGPIGLLMLTVAKLKHPGRLIVTDTKPQRLQIARDLGADVVIDVSDQDPTGVIQDLTDGYGCDVFIEATGYPTAVQQGLAAVRKLGRLVVFGVFGAAVTTDWSVIGDRKELDVLGAHLGPYSYPVAIDLLHRRIVDPDVIVTHSLPLDRFDEGLDILQRGAGIKVMLLPQGV